MENYDRQQDGGNFGEVREDTFVGPFDGQEAVSDDAGSGDYWRGLLDRDPPQEEQQGYVESEYDPGNDYDPGFIPEGEYEPGSEYDPLYTWAGFEDDVAAEQPVDAPAADPQGGTQPPEYTGQAGTDTGDAEIEMFPMYAGRAGADADDGEIQMFSEYAGQADADAAVDENDIEMLSDDAEQADSDANNKQFVNGLYERYPKELAEDHNLQWQELKLQGYYKAISSVHAPEDATLAEATHVEEVYERLKTSIHEIEQKRDSYLQQVEESRRTEREELFKKEFEEEKRAIQEDERPFYERLSFGDSDEDVVHHMDKPGYTPGGRETFKTMFGYDPGEQGVDHMDDHADPVGDLWMP